MFRLRTLLPMSVGYAAGYVMGARSGRPTYDRMMATVGRYAEGYGLGPANHSGESAADKANDEIRHLRESAPDSTVPAGRPDEGRSHGPIDDGSAPVGSPDEGRAPGPNVH